MRFTHLPLTLGVAAACTSCVGPWPEGQSDVEPHVAFVYADSVGDHGLSTTHETARLYLEDNLGITTTRQELVGAADLGSVIDSLVDEDWNIFVNASATYVSSTQQSAVDHPDDHFLLIAGTVSGPNLKSYFARIYQPLFVSGYLAGLMTCTNHLGMVGKFPIPAQVVNLNAFALGARLANPDVVIDLRWINNTSDPELEEQLTLDLIDNGADVILTATNSSVVVETVEDQFVQCEDDQTSEVYSIGLHNPDGCDSGPERCLTSAYWNWGPLFEEAILSISDQTWDELDVSFRPMTSDSSSPVGLSELTNAVPGTIRAEVDALRVDTLAGPQAAPFVGPVYDNMGTQRLSNGEEMDDESINRMCWYVEGVVTTEGGTMVDAVVPAVCTGDH